MIGGHDLSRRRRVGHAMTHRQIIAVAALALLYVVVQLAALAILLRAWTVLPQ